MKLTNKYNLPKALVRAIEFDDYTYTGNISVTQLISPPQLRWLTKRHEDSLEEDVTDRIWLLLGSAVHTILERAEDSQAPDLQEVRLEAETGGWTWSGQADIWEAPDSLFDYKITSSFAGVFGLKDEWVWQLNMLAYLYRKAGFPVNKLGITAIYRDWSKFKMMASENYPRRNAEVINIPLKTTEEIEEYVLERIKLHKDSEHFPDDQLPECTEKERWQKETTYAVMKGTNKRATRVVSNYEEAEVIVADLSEKKPKDKFTIIVRPGESTRCKFYCPVKHLCHQYKRMYPDG